MALTTVNKAPSHKDLRVFGLLLPPFFGLLGLILLHRTGSAYAGRAVWLAGLVVCLTYLAVPPLRRPVFLGWSYATYPIGWLISHLVLGIVYFGVVTPIAALVRLLGQDPMQRRADRTTSTYWEGRDPDIDVRRYFRQF
ncbi:MAG: SxtJ family membrane protein [Actinomycetota bacterium]|nr:SxtJ family membrane protein [Actinomycetota bacterium]